MVFVVSISVGIIVASVFVGDVLIVSTVSGVLGASCPVRSRSVHESSVSVHEVSLSSDCCTAASGLTTGS